jgi:hypothetical protein
MSEKNFVMNMRDGRKSWCLDVEIGEWIVEKFLMIESLMTKKKARVISY